MKNAMYGSTVEASVLGSWRGEEELDSSNSDSEVSGPSRNSDYFLLNKNRVRVTAISEE